VRACLGALSVLPAAALLALVMPKLTHAGWRAIGDSESDLPPMRLAELTAIWGLGLYTYTFALAAALPGLRRSHALVLNLSGSGVANVLPLGGTAGIGLNYAMLHSWGYDRKRATTFTVVSQAAGAAMKVGFAIVGVFGLLLYPHAQRAFPLHAGGPRLLLPIVALPAAVISLVWLRRGRHWLWVHVARRRIADVLAHIREEMRGRWRRVVLGSAGYAVLQLMLFATCLNVAQARVSLSVVVLGFGIDRLLTLIPLTPGGVGVVEAGTSGLLIAMGGDPAAVVTGVLLFRGFSYLAEIPIGGTVALGWLAWRARRRAAGDPAE
jgi:uncharacterized membrane protein YbhN (UPF0104 family)